MWFRIIVNSKKAYNNLIHLLQFSVQLCTSVCLQKRSSADLKASSPCFLFLQPELHFFKLGNTNLSSQSTFVNKATIFVVFIEIYYVCHFFFSAFPLAELRVTSSWTVEGAAFEYANFYVLFSINFEVTF